MPFEPDWRKLSQVLQDQDYRPYSHKVKALAEEYQRQLAAAGLVVVRREDVQGATAVLLGVANSDETNAASAARLMSDLHAQLAAAQDAGEGE